MVNLNKHANALIGKIVKHSPIQAYGTDKDKDMKRDGLA